LYKRCHETRSIPDRKLSIKACAESHENPKIQSIYGIGAVPSSTCRYDFET
jgi:hypothetical protein